MSHNLLITLIFAAVALPVAVFSISALLAISPKDLSGTPHAAEDFLLANREISPGDFVNSSTGYMLQISTTFYFIFWGYNYGFSNIFYVLTWGLGILIFSRFVPQLFFLRQRYTTIPRLVSFDGSLSLRKLAAAATMISFIGVIYVEANFVSDLVLSGSGLQSGESPKQFTPVWWSVFSLIIILTFAYSGLGGLRKVVANDVWQLAFAYVGLSCVFAYLLNITYTTSTTNGAVMSALIIAILVTLMVFDRRIRDNNAKFVGLAISLGLIVAVTIHAASSNSTNWTKITIPGPLHQLSEALGWVTLLGFTLTNICWQFSDSSVLQRISALNLSSERDEGEAQLKKAIRTLAIVSPLTWGFGIILGMLIRTADVPVSGMFSEYIGLMDFLQGGVARGDIVAGIVLVALTMGLVAIMMSTVDVAIIATTQCFFTDFRDPRQFQVRHAIIFSGCLLALVYCAAFAHARSVAESPGVQSSILTFMAGAYGALLALAPSAFQRLRGRPPQVLPESVGIIVGLVGSLAAALGYLPLLPANVTLVLPIFMAIVPPAIIIAVASLFSARGVDKTMVQS